MTAIRCALILALVFLPASDLPALTGPGTELVYAASWSMGNSPSGTMISGAGGGALAGGASTGGAFTRGAVCVDRAPAGINSVGLLDSGRIRSSATNMAAKKRVSIETTSIGISIFRSRTG